MNYKHTQVSYPIIIITLGIAIFFVWIYLTAAAEAPSINSGPNFAITTIMAIMVLVLASFITLQVHINEKYLCIKFGYGIYQKRFSLKEIQSVKTVKNHWYYGRGIKVWFQPKMWIYSISGLNAVELKMKNGKIYRIGTDEPQELEQTIPQSIK